MSKVVRKIRKPPAGTAAREAPRATGRSNPQILALSPQEPVAFMIESVVGCKWSMRVLELVRKGVVRPGAMERSTPGLSAKVLSQRLDKFIRFGVLQRVQYPEIPPRVEYHFTPFGEKFHTLIDDVRTLQEQIDTPPSDSRSSP